MKCLKKVTNDLTWVGANDRRLAIFEGVYSVPKGVAYNSYLLMDEKTVLFDTVDKAAKERLMENVAAVLGDRKLDYLVVQHMEPDHSAVIGEVFMKYPEVKIVCNAKTLNFMKQFFDFDMDSRVQIVAEGDVLSTGKHEFHFVMAPMVHWPEVMMTYDATDKILFSADAFGTFGALNGALFADEVDFARDYMDEARRYYTNIVGKYGQQVQTVLKKAATLDIALICPLHGFVWRKNMGEILSKYLLWSSYEPEEQGVMIAYASVYGNTENAAEILACRLRDQGIKTEIFDVSVTPASEIVAAAFRFSHLVFASTTYNAGIFVSMEALINDLIAHNIQKRTIAIIENGSWAPTSGNLIREKFETCKNMNIINNMITIRSGLKTDTVEDIYALADELAKTFPAAVQTSAKAAVDVDKKEIDPAAMFNLSYGLFVLTAREGDKDNGCIINTAAQLTATPLRISIAVNKANYTHDMIMNTGEFNLSVLTQEVPFAVFERFGFQSGKTADKFQGMSITRTGNGISYIPENTNAVISGKVVDKLDYGTHTLFIADVTQSSILSDEKSVTYQYYFENIKPAPPKPEEHVSGYVCKICGYVYEGEELPADFICPLCKHGADDFEKIS